MQENLLHSIIFGKGKPLLILHGFLGMSDNWKTLGNRFAETFEVHLIDQRNHGRSFHSENFNYHLLAEDLKHYLKHYHLEQIFLLGHSMGGKTAMLFATKFPEMIEKLIVADMGPQEYPPHHQDILKALEKLNWHLKTFENRKQIDFFLEKDIQNLGIRQFLLKNIYTNKNKKFAFRCNVKSLLKNYNSIGEKLPENAFFEKETLFLKGAFSEYIQKKDAFLIQKHFPKFTLKTIPKTGHWLHAENPKMFYDWVMDFLK